VHVRGVQHFCRVPAGKGLIAGRLAENAARPRVVRPAGGPPSTTADARLCPQTPPPDDPDASAHAALAAALLASALAAFPEHGASVYRLATPACLHAWAARWFGQWGGVDAAAAVPPALLQVVALHGWGGGGAVAAPLGHPAPPRALGGNAGAPREAPTRTVWVPVFQQQQG
jgi:hypothetical protein